MNSSEMQKYLSEYKKIISGQEQTLKVKRDAIRAASSKVEIDKKNSNNLVVFVGTYKVRRVPSGFIETLTTSVDLESEYRKYIDIETGEVYIVDKKGIAYFKEDHNVVNREVTENSIEAHYQKYADVKEEFFTGILTEPQKNVVLRLTKKDQQ